MPAPSSVRVAAAAALAALAAAAGGSAAPSRTASLLAAVNAVRAAHGLPAVRLDRSLERAAVEHTRDMLRRDYFGHGSVQARLRAAGAQEPVLGENLAWSSAAGAVPARIVEQWLRSPGHRRNLLRPGFRRIGIGVAEGSFRGVRSATVVTADFGGT